MASDPTYSFENEDGTPPRTEFDEHQRTFDAFMALSKWAIGVVALILIGMAVFLL